MEKGGIIIESGEQIPHMLEFDNDGSSGITMNVEANKISEIHARRFFIRQMMRLSKYRCVTAVE